MEKNEKASVVVVDSGSKFMCRTCANTCGSFHSINSKISHFTPTLKDMIILLVPQMETMLDDNDVICIICRKILVRCVKFIQKCLSVQADLKNLSCQKAPVNNSHLNDLECLETSATDVARDQFTGPHSTNFDIDNGFDVEVIKIEGDDIFSGVQKHNSIDRPNGDFEHYFKADENIDIIERENSHSVKELPSNVPSHNRLISVSQLSTKQLNVFIDNLTSSDVETIHFPQSSQQTTERKRIILVGSTFKCNLCSEYFITKGKNYHHMRMHKKLEQKQAEKEKLKKKRLQKLEEKKRKFNAQMSPSKRKKLSNHKVDLECKTCLKKCSSKDDLAFHMKIHPPFVCEKCGKGFAKSYQMSVHKNVHNDPNSFLCEVCGKAYKTQNQLTAHKLLHENKLVLCNRCPKVFNTGIKLRKHLKYTHGEGLTKVWPCKECKKVFKVRGRLKIHYSHMHLKENRYICEVCGQGFSRSDYLKRHERRHTIYEEKKRSRLLPVSYQCQICTKVFKSMNNLKLHIKRHGMLSRFSCKYCSMTFKIKYQRNAHEKLHEQSQLKYRCGICWKRLESQEELDQHSLMHNNLKHKCQLCEQSFARKHLLDDHFVNSHTENGDAEEEMRTLLAAGLGKLNRSKL